jgi:hypothetical protein
MVLAGLEAEGVVSHDIGIPEGMAQNHCGPHHHTSS